MKLQHTHSLYNVFLVILLIISVESCTKSDKEIEVVKEDNYLHIGTPLIASRFNNLEELKEVVDIEYAVFGDSAGAVRLKYGNIVSELKSGISQNDIIKVREGKIKDAFNVLVESPWIIRNRVDLNKIYKLSRRRPLIFGVDDVAFYDLALSMVSKINFEYTEIQSPRDTSEKGYINTFNHIVAQAIITSLYSERTADFVADVHELKNMPELVHGKFSNEQLIDSNNNPVDNYVDMINNEIGQQMGLYLKKKHHIERDMEWDVELFEVYMNDLFHLIKLLMNIISEPYERDEAVNVKFVFKLNYSKGELSYFETKK